MADMMDIRAMIIRGLKNGWLQVLIISIILGCISVLAVVTAGITKNISMFVIFKRMIFMFIITLSWSFLLLLLFFAIILPYMAKHYSNKTVSNDMPDEVNSAKKAEQNIKSDAGLAKTT